METSERTGKIVVILTPDGQIQRAYKTVHTVITDGERTHTLDPRDVDIASEDAAAYFGAASAATLDNVQEERARADAAEQNLAEAVRSAAAEGHRANAAEAKIASALAALA